MKKLIPLLLLPVSIAFSGCENTQKSSTWSERQFLKQEIDPQTLKSTDRIDQEITQDDIKPQKVFAERYLNDKGDRGKHAREFIGQACKTKTRYGVEFCFLEIFLDSTLNDIEKRAFVNLDSIVETLTSARNVRPDYEPNLAAKGILYSKFNKRYGRIKASQGVLLEPDYFLKRGCVTEGKLQTHYERIISSSACFVYAKEYSGEGRSKRIYGQNAAFTEKYLKYAMQLGLPAAHSELGLLYLTNPKFEAAKDLKKEGKRLINYARENLLDPRAMLIKETLKKQNFGYESLQKMGTPLLWRA